MKILIDGNICSGKSYFLKNLDLKYQIYNMFDIEDSMTGKLIMNNIDFLSMSYRNPKKYSFITQLLFMDLFNIRNKKTNKKNIIHSRSIYSVHNVFSFNHFKFGNINKDEFTILENKFKSYKENFDYDYLIFLRCKDNKTLINRFEKRNEFSKNPKLDNNYLISLNKTYDNLLEEYKKMPFKKIFIIDTDKENEKYINDIYNFIIKEGYCNE